MHRNDSKSKLATVVLVAAIGLAHGGKGKAVASQSTRVAKAQRERVLDTYGSVQRSPTFGAPNPNHPALTGGGSVGYNANLYVY